MNTKSFILGLVAGVVLTLVALVVIGLAKQGTAENEAIQFLEQPVSYENKTEASFQVFQVFGDEALAKEESDRVGDKVLYFGNVVVLRGTDFYSDQVVTIMNPKRTGSYSYETNNGMPKTVPIIEGEYK